MYADNKSIHEYEARRRCEGFICEVGHLAKDYYFHVVSEAAEAGVGGQTVLYDVKRVVFSGGDARTTWRRLLLRVSVHLSTMWI